MAKLKFLAAALTAASFSFAFAQGTPPHPAANPAVGAGQRSTENTPMGTTGTPGSRTMGAQGSTGTEATTAGTTMNSGSTMSTDTGASASSMNSTGGKHKAKMHAKAKAKHRKVAKADRN